jgi:hypothetical protein
MKQEYEFRWMELSRIMSSSGGLILVVSNLKVQLPSINKLAHFMYSYKSWRYDFFME